MTMIIPAEVVMDLLKNKGRCTTDGILARYIINQCKERNIQFECVKVCPFYRRDEDTPSGCSTPSAYARARDYLVEHYPTEAYKFFLREG